MTRNGDKYSHPGFPDLERGLNPVVETQAQSYSEITL